MKIRKHRFYFFILLFAASSLLVHFPSDFEAFAIDNPTHVGSLKVSTNNADTPRHITFNTDGTKMFIIDGSQDYVRQYSLSTGFDISTAEYDSNSERFDLFLNAATGDGQPRQMVFNTDGTKMFVIGNAADEINEYDLSPGFDVSTGSFNSRIDITNTVGGGPHGLAFNTDGTKMFVAEKTGSNALHEFTLTTGFDISTANNDGTHVTSNVLSEQDGKRHGISFNTDGTKLFVVGNNVNSIGSDDSVNEYILSTGFDISTATYDSTFDVSNEEPDPHGIAFSADGTKMFILAPKIDNGDGTGKVNEYTLPTAFNIVDDGPTVTITTSNGNCDDTVSSTTLSYTATFSESVTNFVIGDITVTGTANGGSPEASNFDGSGTTYTFDVVQGSSDGTVSVSIAEGIAIDVSTDENSASNTCTLTIETVEPTVTITSSSGDSGDTTSSTTLSYTATFSESTSNFVVGDITVTGTANGGSPEASNFDGSGTTYTFDVVQGSSDGTVSVSIATGVATDAAGNDNTASNTYTSTISTTTSTGGTCTRHVILGNCGTITINNDEYQIIDTWTDVPTTEVLVGQPVTVTLSTTNNPTHTKIHFASVHTNVFSVSANFDQTAHIDYSPVNNQVTYISQSQLFQVAGATHRIVQDSDVKNLELFEVVFTMIFAKPMDTSHVVVETENKHGIPETLYLLDALKVNENLPQALTLEEKSKFSIVDPEPEPEMDPEPEQTKKEKSKRPR